MSDSLSLVAFGVLALLTLGGAIAMLASRNIVHMAYWLLAVSVAAAGLFALLHAEYVALIQLLVYAGAVAILNIFTIMITMRSREDAVRDRDFAWSGVVLALAFFAMSVLLIMTAKLPAGQTPAVFPSLVDFGRLLFSPKGWALPFEIASLVLTAALVAAVWWSKEGDE